MITRLVQDRPADGVLRLTLDDDRCRNALDATLLAELADLIEQAQARCIVIRGGEHAFSAGYDLRGLRGPELEQRAKALVAHPRHRIFDALEQSAAPVIAQLSGVAIGGGLELAICCDLRFAGESASFGMPAGQLGLTYSHTGLRRFVETIGLAATKELFLLGRRVDAPRALRLGLVTEVVADDALEAAVLTAASEIAELAPRATAGNRRILEQLRGAGRAIDGALAAELEALHDACFSSGELAEGIAAFEEGRPPRF